MVGRDARTGPPRHFLTAFLAIGGIFVTESHLGLSNLINRAAMWAGVGHQAEYALPRLARKAYSGLPYSN
jgi:hypothetical protein